MVAEQGKLPIAIVWSALSKRYLSLCPVVTGCTDRPGTRLVSGTKVQPSRYILMKPFIILVVWTMLWHERSFCPLFFFSQQPNEDIH